MAITAAALAINNRLAPRAAPRHGRGDGLDAQAASIAVTALRTGIDPNVEAGADITVHSGCVRVRFAVRGAGGDDDPVRAAVSRL